MLDDEAASKELLRWFEGIEEARNMPWRKKWLDPAAFVGREEEFGKVLEKRAYEVWVSEVSKWFFFAIGCGAREGVVVYALDA